MADGSVTPQRIQLRRTKGWRKPAGAIVVARPTRWGNPWRVGEVIGTDLDSDYTAGVVIDAALAVDLYRHALLGPAMHRNVLRGLDYDAEDVRAELAGFDLCCWCPLDGVPCHADVLLEIANSGGSPTT